MSLRKDLVSDDFRALSAHLGKDPLQVQGPGGNTSVKADDVMWIKASGTELADADEKDIFVPVDRNAAVAEAKGKAGDGSCKATVLDPSIRLRPSIETTFHAALDHSVVAHSHSIATIVHAISPEGRNVATGKLGGLPFVLVPYAKPGLPLTTEILARISPETRVIILQNHGLICCGDSVDETAALIREVEARLYMPVVNHAAVQDLEGTEEPGFGRAEESWIAFDDRACKLAGTGSYYPDHVVFLGPALPASDNDGNPPAILKPGEGIYLRNNATSAQRAMLRCLSDVLARLPASWSAEAIGPSAEAELLNWDAEKYRQSLAAGA